MSKHVIHHNSPEALQREQLQEIPHAREDAQRVQSQPGWYERWRFDAHLDDGSIVLITFFNKPLFERSAKLNPGVSISIIQPDGRQENQTVQVEPELYSASKERCYVRAGKCWVRGDMDWKYEVDVQIENLGAHFNLTGLVPSWRPGTGKFGVEGQPNFISWLVGIPHGTLEGMLMINGKLRPVRGTCYHDHIWGNLDLNRVFTQWYLGHAHLGDYTFLFLEITSAPDYGDEKLSTLMLAKSRQVLIQDSRIPALSEGEFLPDEGGRSYPKTLIGCLENLSADPIERVRFSLGDPVVLDSFSLVDFLPTWKRLVGGILSNPYHFTFSADIHLEIEQGGQRELEEGRILYDLALLR